MSASKRNLAQQAATCKSGEDPVAAILAFGGYRDNAETFHWQVCQALALAGWHISTEVAIDYHEDRLGRIDIVAQRNGVAIAIECDRRSPRRKSLLKLRAFRGFGCSQRFVVLRLPVMPPADFHGVTVFGVEVSP